MKRIKKLMLLAALLLAGTAQATYLPVGVQTNVSVSTVNGWGWTQCYSDSGNVVASLSSILGSCSGNYLMLADIVPGSNSFSVLAAAARADVLFDTGVQSGYGSDVTHTANGAEWYFSNNWSWGFAELGAKVELYSCDINLYYSSSKGSCWHTNSAMLTYGWGYNDGSFHYGGTRVILMADSIDGNVPEPGTLALVALGVLAVAGVRSRKPV
ncbi:PEP-CTERM sorting domain-containing protein [Viridibacterium curvum]|uniref:Ice-binding protein C-terminal domain-containing protein n=1 Tax=Viridibacterium curvum TaxID=1101404 RepID=A0ABP9QSH8_9RHOO